MRFAVSRGELEAAFGADRVTVILPERLSPLIVHPAEAGCGRSAGPAAAVGRRDRVPLVNDARTPLAGLVSLDDGGWAVLSDGGTVRLVRPGGDAPTPVLSMC